MRKLRPAILAQNTHEFNIKLMENIRNLTLYGKHAIVKGLSGASISFLLLNFNNIKLEPLNKTVGECCLVGGLVVFSVPSTARSFRDGTPFTVPCEGREAR